MCCFCSHELLQDAWLDSLEVDPKYAGKVPNVTTNDNDAPELSSSDIGKIKRRIADILEPGETVVLILLFFFISCSVQFFSIAPMKHVLELPAKFLSICCVTAVLLLCFCLAHVLSIYLTFYVPFFDWKSEQPNRAIFSLLQICTYGLMGR